MAYFESRLKINFDDFNEVRKKLEFCQKLGIKNLILEPINPSQKISRFLKEEIKKISKSNIYYRYNLKPININEFKKEITRYNNKRDIVSVETLNKEVQIYAARDSRVDIISFSELDLIKSLTDGIISLIKQNNSFIEFSLAPVMMSQKSIQSKKFRILYRYIHKIRNSKVNYIISGNPTEIFDIRHPRALVSICHTLFEIPLQEAKRIFKINPLNLLKRVDEFKIEDDIKLIQRKDYES